MALDTLYVFLQYIISNLQNNNGGVFLIEAHIAKLLIRKINNKVNANIPYPIPRDTGHIEYLIPGGAKLGRSGDYYIKAYTTHDIPDLVKSIY
jgi:hypothetical protein